MTNGGVYCINPPVMDYEHNPPSLLMGLPSGIGGTRVTLGMMRDLIRSGSRLVPIRQLAVNLTNMLPQKNWKAETNALFTFVRDKIRYVKDIAGTETLHTADRVLANKAGDCDDKCILLGSLLKSIGHPVRIVAIGFKTPNSCEHVYLETRPGNVGDWIALETTMPVPMGWSPALDKPPTKIIKVEV